LVKKLLTILIQTHSHRRNKIVVYLEEGEMVEVKVVYDKILLSYKDEWKDNRLGYPNQGFNNLELANIKSVQRAI